MKIFAIRDASLEKEVDLAYLLYYEKPKAFYIEIPEGRSEWEVPLLLSTFVRRGEYTINAYWSKVWVQQRIVPADRQNLGQILRANGLEEYDEYALLMLANGRCAQDDCYLIPVESELLERNLRKRFERRVEDILAVKDMSVLIVFRDGNIRKIELEKYLEEHSPFAPLRRGPQFFRQVHVQPGGYGITWGENTSISSEELYYMGQVIPLTREDFCYFGAERLVNTAEAADILECSRQNIEDLVRRGKLSPIKSTAKNRLFLKSEIEQRRWI